MLLCHTVVIFYELLTRTEQGNRQISAFSFYTKKLSFSVTLPLEIHSLTKTEEESGHKKETRLIFHEWTIQLCGLLWFY